MILLLEPSKDLARTISKALEKQGIECIAAHRSDQAIKMADNFKPEAVVVELLMPKHNGLEFIYEFRSYADWLDKPIIIYSHLSSEELGLSEQLKRDMGIAAQLYKPTTSLNDLINEIKKAVERE